MSLTCNQALFFRTEVGGRKGKSRPDTFGWRVARQKSRIWTFIWLDVKQKKTTSQIMIGYLAWGVISGRDDCWGRAVDVESY